VSLQDNQEAPANPGLDDEIARLEQKAAQFAPVNPGQPPGHQALPVDGSAQLIKEYSEILTALYSPTALILAPGWGLQPEEINALAEGHAPVFAKYFPSVGSFGPEIGAALVTIAIFSPRVALKLPRKLPKQTAPEPEPAPKVKTAPKVQTAPRKKTQKKAPVKKKLANE